MIKSNTGPLDRVLDVGFNLDELTLQAGSMFGKLLFLLYLYHTLFIPTGLFFATSIFNTSEFGAASLKRLAICFLAVCHITLTIAFSFGVANILISVASIVMLSGLVGVGQRLSTAYADVRGALQELEMAAHKDDDDTLTLKEKTRLRILESRFSRPCPLRPLDTFNVNSASGASLAGLILTYLIVLLQWKLSEKRE